MKKHHAAGNKMLKQISKGLTNHFEDKSVIQKDQKVATLERKGY